MQFKETPFWNWWKEYGNHFYAVSIIVLLIFVWHAYAENTALQQEVSYQCGWEGEEVKCSCVNPNNIQFSDAVKNISLKDIDANG